MMPKRICLIIIIIIKKGGNEMVLPNLEQGKRKSSVDEGIGGHVLGSDYKIESVK